MVTFLFLTFTLLYLTRPYRAIRWVRAVVVALPGAYVLCDYGENITILAVVSTYPVRLDAVAWIGSVLWMAKPSRRTSHW